MYSNELQILKTAIVNEMEGYQFYKLAAQQIESQETKDAFNFLAEEEEKHRLWLLNMYNSLSKQMAPDPKPIVDHPSPGVFDPAKVRPESGSLEVSVFRIGILMEKASAEFYKKAAAEAKVEAVKELCTRLADWENNHLEMLEKTYDFLKEEWWDKQGFSPA